jgi:hypothetical protein
VMLGIHDLSFKGGNSAGTGYVLGGDVGVNNVDPNLGDNTYQMDVGANGLFSMTPGTQLVGGSIILGDEADVWDVFVAGQHGSGWNATNPTTGNPTIGGSIYPIDNFPPDLPIFLSSAYSVDTLCGAFAAVDTDDITVDKNTNYGTLPPDTYGDIQVKDGGTITFTAGTYTFRTFHTGQNVTIYTTSGTEIDIWGDGDTHSFEFNLGGNGSFFGGNGSDQIAKICVQDDDTGDTVNFSDNGEFWGKIYAPSSTLGLGRGFDHHGRFIAYSIHSDFNDNLNCETLCTPPETTTTTTVPETTTTTTTEETTTVPEITTTTTTEETTTTEPCVFDSTTTTLAEDTALDFPAGPNTSPTTSGLLLGSFGLFALAFSPQARRRGPRLVIRGAFSLTIITAAILLTGVSSTPPASAWTGLIDSGLDGLAIYGQGVSADATVQLGTGAVSRGGLVAAKNDVTFLGTANAYGSLAGRDTSLGTNAGGANANDAALGFTLDAITNEDLVLQSGAHILGDADAATASLGGAPPACIDGTLTLPPSVTPTGGGAAPPTACNDFVNGSPATFAPPTLPTAGPYNFSTLAADDRSCTGACTTLTLGPGVYRDLSVGTSKTLNLSSGRYDFRTFSVGGSSVINMTITAGASIEIYVGSTTSSAVTLGTSVTVNVIGGTARDVYLETAGQFSMAGYGLWQGTVYSTNTTTHEDVYTVDFGTCDTIVGALFSTREVRLGGNNGTGQPGSVLHYEPYKGWFPAGPFAPSPLWTACEPPPPPDTSSTTTTTTTTTTPVTTTTTTTEETTTVPETTTTTTTEETTTTTTTEETTTTEQTTVPEETTTTTTTEERTTTTTTAPSCSTTSTTQTTTTTEATTTTTEETTTVPETTTTTTTEETTTVPETTTTTTTTTNVTTTVPEETTTTTTTTEATTTVPEETTTTTTTTQQTTVPDETTTTTTTTSTTDPSTSASPTPFNGADSATPWTPTGNSGSASLALALLFGSAGLVLFAIAPWRRRRPN